MATWKKVLTKGAVVSSDLTTDGSNGQVLTTDGSGNLSFTSKTVNTNTTYSVATSNSLGLVKIGYTESGKNYPVELSNQQMYVNVPWTNTTYSVGDGGLTQKNFTSTLKTKLDNIATQADKYSSWTINGGNATGIGSGKSVTFTGSGATSVSQTNASGSSTITITSTNTTYTRSSFIDQDVDTDSNVSFNNLTVGGNLTVNGTTTTINTATINLEDNNIKLNSNASNYPNSDNGSTTSAGLEVERGSAGNAYFTFKENGGGTSNDNKGYWTMYRPTEQSGQQANAKNISNLAQVCSLQVASGTPTSSTKGHVVGGLYYDTSANCLYVCDSDFVDESGGGGA